MMRQWVIGIISLGSMINAGQAINERNDTGESDLKDQKRHSVIQHVVKNSTGWTVRPIDLTNQAVSPSEKVRELIDLTNDDSPLPHTTQQYMGLATSSQSPKATSHWTSEERFQAAVLIQEKYLQKSESIYPPPFISTSSPTSSALHPLELLCTAIEYIEEQKDSCGTPLNDSQHSSTQSPISSTSDSITLQEDPQPQLEDLRKKRATHPPAVKNMILAALASGEHPDVLATRHDIPKNTIRSWQRRIPTEILTPHAGPID